MAYRLWLMVGPPLPAKRIQTAEPQAAVWGIRNQRLVLSENLLENVGSCGEAICVICLICGLIKIRVHSCPFVVKNLSNLSNLWFLTH